MKKIIVALLIGNLALSILMISSPTIVRLLVDTIIDETQFEQLMDGTSSTINTITFSPTLHITQKIFIVIPILIVILSLITLILVLRKIKT